MAKKKVNANATETQNVGKGINDAIQNRIDFLKEYTGKAFATTEHSKEYSDKYTDDDIKITDAYNNIMNYKLKEKFLIFLENKWDITQSGYPIIQRLPNDPEEYNQHVKSEENAYWWFECKEKQFESYPFSISIFIDSEGVKVNNVLHQNKSNEYTQVLEKKHKLEKSDPVTCGDNYAESIKNALEQLKKSYEEVVKEMSIIQNKIGQAFSEGKKQIVLTGAPGTGKTHAARQYPLDMIEQEMEGKSKEEIAEEKKRRIKFVQFHPSFDYTDFVEGLKPVELEKEPSEGTEENETNTSTTNIEQQSEGSKSEYSFVRVDGIFKAFCRSIVEQNDKDKESEKEPPYYYFIIDEINRADLSKVFGELMYGLEESYRGRSENCPQSQYSYLPTYRKKENGKWERISKDVFADGFYIPENLRIIGTMNDIDRSVETFDFALRRRFRWIDIKANDVMANVLRGITKIPEAQIGEAVKQIKKMNGVISGEEGRKFRLSEAFHIGPSYFKTLEYNNKKFNWEDVFNREIEPILREYVRPYNAESQTEFIGACKTALTEKDDKKTKEEDNQNGSPDNSETTNNTSNEDTE